MTQTRGAMGRLRVLAALVTIVAVMAASGACAQTPTVTCNASRADRGCVRVLFIGNSYTYVNNLPGTFASIAAKLGRAVYTDMIAPGGATLADHLKNDETLSLIRNGHWTYVVLQEQSLMPVKTQSRTTVTLPAARQLVEMIRSTGAQPVLYQTWGRQHGWPDGQIADFATMQDSLTSGYRVMAAELNAKVVPVGEAWRLLTRERPEIPLWQSDESHPTVQGTYVAANAFVVALLNEHPRGLIAQGSVPEHQVSALQQAAARAVSAAR